MTAIQAFKSWPYCRCKPSKQLSIPFSHQTAEIYILYKPDQTKFLITYKQASKTLVATLPVFCLRYLLFWNLWTDEPQHKSWSKFRRNLSYGPEILYQGPHSHSLLRGCLRDFLGLKFWPKGIFWAYERCWVFFGYCTFRQLKWTIT